MSSQKKAQGMAIALFCLTTTLFGASAPYTTDFESGAGSEWSDSTVDATHPGVFTKFAGRYSNHAQTLTLTGLTAGQSYVVNFDLYVIDTWDGDAGGDSFIVEANGEQLFRHTFANYNGNPPSSTQSYPAEPLGGRQLLGFWEPYVDAIYPGVRVRFTPSGTTAEITFRGTSLQDISDESWGIDNVWVKLASEVGPVTFRAANLPAADGVTGEALDQILLVATEQLEAATAGNNTNYTLREAGADRLFATGDDLVLPTQATFTGFHTVRIAIQDYPLQPGKYRIEARNVTSQDQGAVPAFNHVFNVEHPVLGRIESLSNDTLPQAMTLPLTETPVGSGFLTAFGTGFLGPDNYDYWRFDAKTGDYLLISVESGGNGYPFIYLFNASEAHLTSTGYYDSSHAALGYTFSADGTYYIRIWNPNWGARTSYEMRLDLGRGLALERENNDSVGELNALSFTSSGGAIVTKVQGAIEANDTPGDYYRLGSLNVGNGVAVSLAFPLGSSLDASTALIAVYQEGVAEPVEQGAGASLNFTAQADGFYILRVYSSKPDFRAQYVLTATMTDGVVPAVASTTLPSGTSSMVLDRFSLTLTEELDVASTMEAANYEFRNAGADNIFGNADDSLYAVAPQTYGSGLVVNYILSDGPAQPGKYRFTARNLKDRAGNVFPSAYTAEFTLEDLPGFKLENRSNETYANATVLTLVEAGNGIENTFGRGNLTHSNDADHYAFEATQGQVVQLASETPDFAGGTGLYWQMVQEGGPQIIGFYPDSRGSGQATAVIPATGRYIVRPHWWHGYLGEYRFRVTLAPAGTQVEQEDNSGPGSAHSPTFTTSNGSYTATILGYSSQIDAAGSPDYYRIGQLGANSRVTARVVATTGSPAAPQLAIIKGDGAAAETTAGADGSVILESSVAADGPYFAVVTDATGDITRQYRVTITVNDVVRPQVVAVTLPAESSSVTVGPSLFTVTFGEDMLAASLNDSATFALVSAGADNNFGTGDDSAYQLTHPDYLEGLSLNFTIADGPPQPGRYQFRVTTAAKDRANNALAATYVRSFEVGTVPGFVWEGRGNQNQATATSLSTGASSGLSGSFVVRSITGGVNYNPWSVALGDFDRDGIMDAATANSGSATVGVLIGKTGLEFETPVTLQAGSAPISVATADFNGDGILDLVAANYHTSHLSYYTGNGDGTFAESVNLQVLANPRWVVAADLNGDGRQDIVTTSVGAASVSVLRGRGDGTFEDRVDLASGSTTFGVAVGDLNGDGVTDIVSANTGAHTITVFLATAPGVFAAGVSYPTGNSPRVPAIGDFNGDGIKDVIVLHAGQSWLGYFAGRAGGTFAEVEQVEATSSDAYDVVVGDWDADGKADFLTANYGRSEVVLVRGNGDGTFRSPSYTRVNGNPINLKTQDLNGDGRAEVVTALYNSHGVAVLESRREELMAEDPANGGYFYGSARGYLTDGNDQDFWSFSGKAGDQVMVAAESTGFPMNSGLHYQIQDNLGNNLRDLVADTYGWGSSVPMTLPYDGTYYVRVSPWHGYYSEYRFRVTRAESPFQVESPDNNSFGAAQRINISLLEGGQQGAVGGVFMQNDPDGDYYALGNVAAGSALRLSLARPGFSQVGARAHLYKAGPTLVASSEAGANLLEYIVPEGGDAEYFVHLEYVSPSRASDAGPYLEFNGNGARVDTGRWAPGNAFTVEAWVRADGWPWGRRGIVGGLAECQDWGLVQNNGPDGGSGDFALVIRPPGGCSDVIHSRIRPALHRWYHLAGTSDGTTARIYVDGVLRGSGPVDPGWAPTSAGSWFGGEVCCGNYFDGSMDNVRVWNRALSEEEVRANMSRAVSPSEAGLAGLWNFEEGQGETLSDSGANARNGTVTGGVWTAGSVSGGTPLGMDAQYVLKVEIGDTAPPEIVSVTLPDEGASDPGLFNSFQVRFSEEMNPATVMDDGNYELRGAGPDNIFGNADDFVYQVRVQTYSGGLTATYLVINGPLQRGNHRFTIRTGLKDRSNSALEQPFVRNFVIVVPAGFVRENRDNDTRETATPLHPGNVLPAVNPAGSGLRTAFGQGALQSVNDLDYWNFTAQAGQHLEIAIETLNFRNGGSQLVQIYRPDGTRIAFFYSTHQGVGNSPWEKHTRLVAPVDGVYTVLITHNHQHLGEYRLRVSSIDLPGTFEYEQPFHGNSQLNDTIAAANEVNFTTQGTHAITTVGGYFSLLDPVGDIFVVRDVLAGTVLTASVTKPGSSAAVPVIAVLDAAGNAVATSSAGASSVSFTTTSAGSTWYVKVSAPEEQLGLQSQYVLKIDMQDSSAFSITSTSLPDENGNTSVLLNNFTIQANKPLSRTTLTADSVQLWNAGFDQQFGTGDDQRYTLEPMDYADGLEVGYEIVDGPLQSGPHRLIVTTALRDRFANALPQQWVRNFRVDVPAGVTTESRDNETLETATSLPLLELLGNLRTAKGRGALTEAEDVDWWSFQADQGQLLIISSTSAGQVNGSQLRYTAYHANGNPLASGDFFTDGRGIGQTPAILVPASGQYFVKVVRSAQYGGEYQLRVTLASPPLQLEIEDNNSVGSSDPLTLAASGEGKAGSMAGHISSSEDRDYFRISPITSGSTVFIATRVPAGSDFQADVGLYNSANGYIVEAGSGRSGDGVAEVRITTDGDYFVVVRGADGDNGIDSQYVVDVQVLPTGSVAFPNLQVVSVTPPSGSVASGQTVPVNFVVRNVGSVNSGASSWVDRLTLSRNNVLGDGDDLPLGLFPHEGVLNAGADYAVNRNVVIPDGISGTFHLIVQADFGNAVNEFVLEGDNTTVSGQFAISLAPYPDLRVEELAAAASPNNSINITWKTANRGNGAAGTGFKERVFVRNSRTGAIVFNTERDVAAIGAGVVLTHSQVVAVGPDSATYQIIVTTDSSSRIYEFGANGHQAAEANAAETSYRVLGQFTVALAVNPPGSGTTQGAGSFQENSSVTVRATPVTTQLPYVFANWTENGVVQSTDANYTFTLTAPRQLVANFVLPRYNVAASVTPNGAGSVEGAGSYSHGAIATLRATAAFGYAFSHWTENGNRLSDSAELSLTVTAARTVVANFREAHLQHVVTTATSPAGLAAIAGAGTYNNGQTANVSAPGSLTKDETIYTFKRFLMNGNPFGTSASFSKTFATTDPTEVLFVAEYDSRSQFPMPTNVVMNLVSPVPRTTDLIITFQFNRSMDPSVTPVVQFQNSRAGAVIPTVSGGTWSSVNSENDTYRTRAITIPAGADGLNRVRLSAARDLFGAVMKPVDAISFDVDATFPVISNVQVTRSAGSALVTWTTDEPASSQVEFGATTAYGRKTALSSTLTTSHRVTVSGLTPNTQYQFRPLSRDRAGNEQTGVNGNFTTLPAPDLRITEITAVPAQLTSGSLLQINWTISNAGVGPAAGAWFDRITVNNLTTSETLLTEDVRYDSAASGAIAAGGTQAGTITLNLPDGPAGAGNLRITVLADFYNNVQEGSTAAEQNNSRTLDVTSTLRNYPDLIVDSLAVAPGSPESGQEITVNWRNFNRGNAPAGGVITDTLQVRNTATGEWLVWQNFSQDTGATPIAANAGLARSYKFRLPDGARGSGTIAVEVTTDVDGAVFEHNGTNTGESNNKGSFNFVSRTANYPDLVIKSISVNGTGVPGGGSLEFTYEIENRGTRETAADFSDQIFLSDDAVIGNDTYIRTINSTQRIAAGATGSRVETITLPQFGTGRRWIVIRTDAGNAIFESNEENNAAVDDQSFEIPASLMLTLNTTSVPENVGAGWAQGTLTRNSGAANAVTVTLASSNPQRLMVPQTVTIEPNQQSVTFPITLIDNALVEEDTVVQITANGAGFPQTSASLEITDNDSAMIQVRADVSRIVENTIVVARVERNTTTTGPLVVSLATTDPIRVSVPPSVTIPAGQRSVAFEVEALDNDTQSRQIAVSVTASVQDFETQPLRLDLVDDDIPTLAIAIAEPIISEGAGNPATSGRVTRSPVTPRPLTVILESTDNSAASVPFTVIIPGGLAVANFNVSAVDDELVDNTQQLRINAYAADSTYNTPIQEGSASADLSVTDDDGPTLTITLDSEVLSERGTVTGHVHRNTNPAASLTVSLISEALDEATVPNSVVIPAGQRSAAFTITGVQDNQADGIQPAAIVVGANGFTSGRATLNVTDIDLPDLRVTQITLPANGLTGGSLNVSWTVKNEGLSTANSPWMDRVYLATSPDGANMQSVGSFFRTTALAVGATYERSALILLPQTPATYYLMVVTDSAFNVNEGSENNNTMVSDSGLTIAPAYRATVSTDVTLAPQGTPIPLTGRAIKTGSGDPAAFAAVSIRFNVKGMRRVVDVRADANGNFGYTFLPLPYEAGRFTVGADHPGVEEDQVQDTFDIAGMRFHDSEISLRAFPLSETTGELVLENLADFEATGLTFLVEGLPAGVEFDLDAPNRLAPLERPVIPFTLGVGNITSELRIQARLKASNSQGAVAYLPLRFTIAPHRPTLAANPGVLSSGMVIGQQQVIEFILSNNGGAATGPLEIRLPALSWLTVSSPTNLPSLAPGEFTKVTVNLTPDASVGLARYDGTIYIVSSSGADLNVPYSFRAISEARGDLKITVEDDYTYHVAGAPKVAEATVLLVDPYTGERIGELETDANGVATFTNVREGSYQMTVSASKHATYRSPVTIVPGVTTEKTVFIDRQTVSYRWTVVPTEIEDKYQVVLESVFEAEVPIPVVTIDNPLLMPLVVRGQDTQMEVRLTNHGLIAAERVSVIVPEHPDYEVIPLIEAIDVLPAKSSMSIPVLVRAKPTVQFATLSDLENRRLLKRQGTTFTGCQVYPKLEVKWSFVCGPDRRWHLEQAQIIAVPADESCWDKIKDLLKDKVKGGVMNPKDLLEWKSHLCDLAAVLASCVDECLGSIVSTICGVASGDIKGAVSGALGLGQCICPTPPSITIPPSTYDPPPIGIGIGVGTGGGGSFDFPIPAPIHWDYTPNCRPGDRVGNARQSAAEQGVCARVRLRIEQEAVITRVAFLGTLELENGLPDMDLTDVQITLDIRDEFQNPANNRFAIRGPELKGLTAIDGTGRIARSSTGEAKYTIIPNRTAAPEGPALYRIGGTLRYREGAELVEVPLVPDTITVYPDPILNLVYFQERDVFADDPFTDEVEPSQPFNLGLLVKNSGKGAALSFRITSAQPKIIENEKGLLIDFKIIGTQVGDEEVTPSLTANLGRIEPGQSKTAAWKMVSTLQGKFIEYTAKFEHITSLGDPQLSLIDSVEIHELIHTVRADRPNDDAMQDFLTNDDPDPAVTPDTLWMSDGSVFPVNLGSNPQADGPAQSDDPEVKVTVQVPSGWVYFNMPDPGAGFRLHRVVRGDGKVIKVGDNAWATDRTFPSTLAGAVRENKLHLFDHNATGGTVQYSVSYRVNDSVIPEISGFAELDPVQGSAVNSVDVIFSEDIDLSTFTVEDLALSFNGGENLLTEGVTISRVADGTYRITGIGGVGGATGNYQLTVRGADITDFGGNAVGGDATLQWSVAGTAPVVASIQPVVPRIRNTPVNSLDVTFSKPIRLASFDFTDLQLTLDGGANLISGPLAIQSVAGSTYRITGLGSLTADSGEYLLTVKASEVDDGAGNNGTGQLSVGWRMDTTAPTVALLEPVNTNPRNIVVLGLEVRFSEPIDEETLSQADLSLTRNGGPNLVTSQVKLTRVNPTTYRITEFNWVSGLEGQYVLSVNAAGVRDLAGNAGTGTASSSWVMDTTKPAAPAGLRIVPDLGASATDGRTSNGQIVFSGTLAENNLSVRLFDVTANEDLGVVVATDRVFSKQFTFAQGAHRLRAVSIDTAANFSEPAFFEVYVDLTAPGVSIEEITPDPRDAAVSSIELTFAEAINPATLTTADLKLARDGGANLLTTGVTLQPVTGNTWRINGLATITEPGGLYTLTVEMAGVEDIAGNKGSGPVTETWRRIGENTAPVLDPITDRIVAAESLLSITAKATDTDIPANKLTYSLLPGAPSGAAINPTTGVFTWRPTRAQAPGVYEITVRVTDDGSPALTDTEAFTVTVTDFAELLVGQGVTQVGSRGAFPIETFFSASVRQFSFVLNTKAGRFANVTVDGLVPEVGSAIIEKLDETRYRVTVTASVGSSFTGRAQLIEVGYNVVAGIRSEFVPVAPSNLTVTKTDNVAITSLFTRGGRVVIIGVEPLLESLRVAGVRKLTLYGNPGVSYQIQTKTDITPAAPWTNLGRITPLGLFETMDVPVNNNRVNFYRAVRIE